MIWYGARLVIFVDFALVSTMLLAAPLAAAQDPGSGFAPSVTYRTGGFQPTAVALADVNGDGRPDLIVANHCSNPQCKTSGVVGVLLGNGDGTFQKAVTYDSGGSVAFSVAVADVNGDAKPDILVANMGDGSSDGSVAVLLGNGDGTFQKAVTYDSGGKYLKSVAIRDVNSDGKADLLLANMGDGSNNGSVGVLLGNGDGSFQKAATFDSGGIGTDWVAVADLKGDGKLDLIVANLCGNDPHCHGSGTVGVLHGNGDGTFRTAVTYDSGGMDAPSLAVADVNGDGKLDIVVTSGDAVGVLLGKGNGTFRKALTYKSGGHEAWAVAVADVNGDGKPDVLVTHGGNNASEHSKVGVLLGNGDGAFQRVATCDSGGVATFSVAVGDVNGDGKPDLIVTNFWENESGRSAPGTVGVLINTSAASARSR
jgi:hypothetical protein